MNIISLTVLAFGMSMDAFAAAIAKGVNQPSLGFAQALKAGLLFGAVEGVMPVLGWLFGAAASGWVSAVDHWIAFGLLAVLGIKFVREAVANDDSDNDSDNGNNNDNDNGNNNNNTASMDNSSNATNPTPSQAGHHLMLVLTALATSIDSLVVGVSLAFLDVNIYVASLLIGMATTIMATLGLYLGRRLGVKFGKVAMCVGGLSMLAIGCMILYEHADHLLG